MLGLMQDWPLRIHRVIDHAAEQHGRQVVVSRSCEGPIHRITYVELRKRSLQVAQRLAREGIKPGDRVATLAWNTWRHLEAWYGIVGCAGVYHTVNPRLFPDQICWIMTHAEDRILMVDLTFVPMLEKFADKLPASLEKVIILTDDAHMPQTALRNAISYESWLAEADGDFAWAEVDENAAAGMCYTSGTTGNPKGVVYSHRSNVLHSLAMCSPDALALGSKRSILPVVPLFHANSWSIAFSAPLAGAKLVMPGPKLDGASVYEMLEMEQVHTTAGVPTVWLMLLQHMEKEGKTLNHLKRVMIGGSAAPRAMIETFEKKYGVEVFHAWGMTEMSPVGSLGIMKAQLGDLDDKALYDVKQKQGFAPFTVEMKITDDAGKRLPWDGKTFGRLKVRGPAVASGYYGGDGGNVLDEEGFFDTGDVSTIDENGYMQITDRSKDVIKSGGEWISSIDLENLAVGHPDVAEAAVIGIHHPKWDERPLLIIVKKPGTEPTKEALLKFMEGKIAKWWMPDDVVFIDQIPHTATGKIQKMELRTIFKDYRLPTASPAEVLSKA
ncbi:long-chain-fatty-acid--CoA ligase [Terrarubrum flagellatum]|uniref:long-chain-fatty-acid--CoA ligase n=1 Tax=Terrirubrum flagellatum TaxID=2895980 RepID=UPI0031455CAA